MRLKNSRLVLAKARTHSRQRSCVADDPTVFDLYVAYSLRQEKRLHDKIHKHINANEGEMLPVQDRMLNSITKAVKASGLRLAALSVSRPKTGRIKIFSNALKLSV